MVAQKPTCKVESLLAVQAFLLRECRLNVKRSARAGSFDFAAILRDGRDVRSEEALSRKVVEEACERLLLPRSLRGVRLLELKDSSLHCPHENVWFQTIRHPSSFKERDSRHHDHGV